MRLDKLQTMIAIRLGGVQLEGASYFDGNCEFADGFVSSLASTSTAPTLQDHAPVDVGAFEKVLAPLLVSSGP